VFQAKSLGDLTELIQLSHYLGIACVGMVLALVATTTIMAVQDRVKEHAVLQTIGFSGPRIFGLVLIESVLTSAAGGVVGVGVAMLALSWSTLAIGAEAVTVSFTPSFQLAASGLLVSVVAGAVAGIIPAWKAAAADIVPALRQA
jgi:putative ABC transport system permease protein